VNVSCALDPRSVSPLWCLSAYRSWAAHCTDLVFVDPGIKINGAYNPKTATSRDARGIGNFFRLSTGQCPSTLAPDTVRLLEQRRRSLHRIFGQQTALTLIRLITGSGASSNSECTSHGCTTLTNWNSVYSKCDVTSTRASLTMHWRVAQAFSCMHAGERWTLRAYAVKQYAYLQSTVRQHKRFNFSNTTRFLIFFLL